MRRRLPVPGMCWRRQHRALLSSGVAFLHPCVLPPGRGAELDAELLKEVEMDDAVAKSQ